MYPIVNCTLTPRIETGISKWRKIRVAHGKRLVLERVNASINFTTHGIRVAALLAPQDVLFVLPAHPVFDPNVFVVNESTLTYFKSAISRFPPRRE